jgi:hypothetical protein
MTGRQDPDITRAEADIARAREDVASSMIALQRELARTLDWRAWVSGRPYLAVGTAFFIGALLGRWHGPLFKKRR